MNLPFLLWLIECRVGPWADLAAEVVASNDPTKMS
jgi:hypothetical protein